MAKEHHNPIEVWLLTGFLGAGKTTLLNSLLKEAYFSGQEAALVINEFGKLGVDSHLLKEHQLPKYEINKGSIFCICTQTEFIKIFQELRQNRPDVIIIEATGIAETSGIEQLLNESVLEKAFDVRANICLIDAENFIQTAAFLKTAVSQVQQADAIVVNKVDLVEDSALAETTAFVKRLNSEAALHQTSYGQVDTAFLSGLHHSKRTGDIAKAPLPQITALRVQTEAVFDRQVFYKTVDQLKEQILRLKGDVNFSDKACFVEIAGKQILEKESLGTLGASTAFSVIGWDIEQEVLQKAFESCMVPMI